MLQMEDVKVVGSPFTRRRDNKLEDGNKRLGQLWQDGRWKPAESRSCHCAHAIAHKVGRGDLLRGVTEVVGVVFSFFPVLRQIHGDRDGEVLVLEKSGVVIVVEGQLFMH